MNIFCGSRSLCHASSNNCARGIVDDSGLRGERWVTPNDSVASQKTLYPQQWLFFAHVDPEDEVTEVRRIIGYDLPVVTALTSQKSRILSEFRRSVWTDGRRHWIDPLPPTHCIRNGDIIKNQDFVKLFRSIVPPPATHRWRCSLSDVMVGRVITVNNTTRSF